VTPEERTELLAKFNTLLMYDSGSEGDKLEELYTEMLDRTEGAENHEEQMYGEKETLTGIYWEVIKEKIRWRVAAQWLWAHASGFHICEGDISAEKYDRDLDHIAEIFTAEKIVSNEDSGPDLEASLLVSTAAWISLKQRAEAAERRVRELESADWFEAQEQKIATVEAQCAAMREATERLQASLGAFLDRYEDRLSSEWPCQGLDDSWETIMYLPHTALRLGLAALATDAGAKMLAEVKRLREFAWAVNHARTSDAIGAAELAEIDAALAALDAGEVTG
jgi:hypothetical protein